ncbi:MAG: Crp/Fnr family transcriptional regulator [Sandaracinaceae bacterium]|nr:Crp/Fnr family transcriptional regulator [Sandaracinaceae bacterium]
MTVEPAVLAELPLFRPLPLEARAALAALASMEKRPSGFVIFEEGDPPGDVFFVLDGRITLTMGAGAGASSARSLAPAEIVGWSSLLGRPRVARAVVSRAATLVRIPASDVLELCERDPRVGYAVMAQAFEQVADRLVDTRMQLLDLYGKSG